MTKRGVGFADLRVGLLVFISICILIAMILSISGDLTFFERPYYIRTKLAQVEGLRPGTEVRLAGVSIGQVTEVNLLPIAQNEQESRSVEVVMKISDTIDGIPAGQRIRTDSRAILGSVGLLGDKVIDITPGTLEGGKPVPNGGEIQSAQEMTIKQLVTGANDILANFTLLSNEVKEIAEKINKGQGTAGKLITDETLYNNLNQTVVEAQNLVKRVREGRGTVGQLLNDPQLYEQVVKVTVQLEKILNEIASGRGTLGKLARDEQLYDNTASSIARLDRIADRLEQIVAKIDRGEGTVGKLITDDSLYTEANATVANLNRISASLARGEGSAGKLLKDPSLYENLNSASLETIKLLSDFRRDPKKYLTIKIRIF
ncbi:MAG: MlaD family protein [Acidobacteriota bacterium]|nr:MlaD family protein [Blastocatellia bacterium]MDW8412588.1 MlaD family protein [Acidobacteriota bacterium]